MRVAWLPKADELAGNPYWPLLARELEALGVTFEHSHSGQWLAGRWLWQHRRSVDVLHFHFIQPHYAGPGGRVSGVRLTKFIAYLLLARLLGYRVVWTLHDFDPTWPLRPAWAERLARRPWLRWPAPSWCTATRRPGCCASATVVAAACGCATILLSRGSTKRAPRRSTRAPNWACPADAFVYGFVGGIRPNKASSTVARLWPSCPATICAC